VALVVLFGLASIIAGAVSEALGAILMVIFGLVYLALLIPSIAVTIRRLHDTGKSGWFLLIALIPLIGSLVMLFFMVSDSDRETNDYGASPKYGAVAA